MVDFKFLFLVCLTISCFNGFATPNECLSNVNIDGVDHLFSTLSLETFDGDLSNFCQKHQILDVECTKIKNFHHNRCFLIESDSNELPSLTTEAEVPNLKTVVGPVLKVMVDEMEHKLQAFVGETSKTATIRFCIDLQLSEENCLKILEAFNVLVEEYNQSMEVQDVSVQTADTNMLAPSQNLATLIQVEDGNNIEAHAVTETILSDVSTEVDLPTSDIEKTVEPFDETATRSHSNKIEDEFVPPSAPNSTDMARYVVYASLFVVPLLIYSVWQGK
jgi:hypothetical protein